MKTSLITLILLLISIANFTIAQNHVHYSSHSKQVLKKTDKINKFIPNSDLKVLMEKILNQIIELNPNKDDIKVVKNYGQKISETVRDIFKTCKLEPEADAAIHPLLSMILKGASDFKNGQFEIGHKKIHEALLGYEQMFHHVGWKY